MELEPVQTLALVQTLPASISLPNGLLPRQNSVAICYIAMLDHSQLLRIFSYLSLKECTRVECVSREWRQVVCQKWRQTNDFNLTKILPISAQQDALKASLVGVWRKIRHQPSVKIELHTSWRPVLSWLLNDLEGIYHPDLRTIVIDPVCLPETLQLQRDCDVADGKLIARSLKLRANTDHDFIEILGQKEFTELRTLHLHLGWGPEVNFDLNGQLFPALQELDMKFVNSIRSAQFLKQLSILRILHFSDSAVSLLKLILSDQCSFRSTLTQLQIGQLLSASEDLLMMLCVLSSLEKLSLISAPQINEKASKSIGENCGKLSELSLDCCIIGSELLQFIPSHFPILKSLTISQQEHFTLEAFSGFLANISTDRMFSLTLWNSNELREEIHAAGIMANYPNVLLNWL